MTGPARASRRSMPALLAGGAAAAFVLLTGCGVDPVTPDDLLEAQSELTSGVAFVSSSGRSAIDLTVEPGALQVADRADAPSAAPLTVAVTCEGDGDAHVGFDGADLGTVSCGFRPGDTGYVALTTADEVDLGLSHAVTVEAGTGAGVAVSVLVAQEG
ncbi:hypothetical protein [Oerskovia sp. USHLN155]|uniref:hypothetical protein n=1 Tax=Oerskovia sp. USHLN155 TaxID=3081288 RepID=UPI0030188862